ncbi:MAG TPA: type II toxin-antitoxin system HicA family toxin [Pirellulales bacterium]|nr:type II toxin-antitoxin system HicA family toxin [Pirellulales bacterium]
MRWHDGFQRNSTSPTSRWVLGRLRTLSGAEACAILAQHGFREVRRRGSHVIMQRTGTDETTTVPVPDHRELRIGTLRSIIRQSGVPRAAFEA